MGKTVSLENRNLVSVDNIRDLKEAYPSYFLDTSEFIHVMESIKKNCRSRGWID